MHYKNGREAKVGDPVVGKTYNTNGATISGTLISLTPGPDSCSCEVGYLSVQPEGSREDRPVRLAGSEKHGGDGPRVVVGFRYDYSECKNLLHAEDALKAASEFASGSRQPLEGEVAPDSPSIDPSSVDASKAVITAK